MESEQSPKSRIKHIVIDRNQLRWQELDLEQLIGQDHSARIIWEVSGRMNLSGFEKEVKTWEGEAGRACWPARVMVCVWVYGYSIGVASARALQRLMKQEPGLRWLVADGEINHHTLSDFRVGHQKAVEDLFTQFLALLDEAGVVDLRTLLVDGTKVRAVAGRGSMHRRKTLEKRLRQARQVVRKLDQEAAEGDEGADQRRRAAQARAAREALERAQAALEKIQQLEAGAKPSEREDLRVSDSEPDARKMKHADGSWAPSYNLQVATEEKAGMIVAVTLTSAANDTQELMPVLEQVQENAGKLPERVIADNGYATRDNVEQTTAKEIEMIAPWKEDASRQAGACARHGIDAEFAPAQFRAQRGGKRLTCPAGKTLVIIGQKTHHGLRMNIFEANRSDCRKCRWAKRCCGKREPPRRLERVAESAAMRKYKARMKRSDTRKLYRKRSQIAEFPHLWVKAVKKWRRFSVRSLLKAGMEASWVALSYNIAQWVRLGQPVATTS